jgi:hypothetical protein
MIQIELNRTPGLQQKGCVNETTRRLMSRSVTDFRINNWFSRDNAMKSTGQLSTWRALLVMISIAASPSLPAKVVEKTKLAQQYASCAAYYLMISKADPKLEKLASVGAVAADNARRLSDSDKTLSMMADETRRMLAQMDNDWAKVGAVIDEKAGSCKALMVAD